MFDTSPKSGQAMMIPVMSASLEIAMIWCPPGEFMMGSPEDDQLADITEKPQFRVKLSQGFWIGQTPVTQAQWQSVMGQPRLFEDNAESNELPAEGITWEEAKTFCQHLSRILREEVFLQDNQLIDLPTEAQWEYACRAGTCSRWYFGDQDAILCEHAWYTINSNDNKHLVGRKAPNPWGIHDLYGNVAEWCLDDFKLYKPTTVCLVDPISMSEDSYMKIARGGAFSYPAKECSSASREVIPKHNPFNESTGLRIVCVDK